MSITVAVCAGIAAAIVIRISYVLGRAAGVAKERARRPPDDPVLVIERLRAVLRTFADAGRDIEFKWADTDRRSTWHSVGAYRRAARAYDETGPGRG